MTTEWRDVTAVARSRRGTGVTIGVTIADIVGGAIGARHSMRTPHASIR
jgi:hypothetical protein